MERGNTVIVIEHNMDVVKTADWIIDMGPEGGHEGGHVVAKGTPEAIAKKKDSPTAAALQAILTHNAAQATAKMLKTKKKRKSEAVVPPCDTITVRGASKITLNISM